MGLIFIWKFVGFENIESFFLFSIFFCVLVAMMRVCSESSIFFYNLFALIGFMRVWEFMDLGKIESFIFKF